MNLKTLLIVVAFFLANTLFGQLITKKDGIYINENGEKYAGLYISYYPNKAKKAVYAIKDGVEDGSVEFYYSTTEIMEQGNFKDGVKHGKWVRWSIEGDKLAEANYKKGGKEGKWIIWDERGIKRYEMYYTNGIKAGIWLMWDEKGQISNKKEY